MGHNSEISALSGNVGSTGYWPVKGSGRAKRATAEEEQSEAQETQDSAPSPVTEETKTDGKAKNAAHAIKAALRELAGEEGKPGHGWAVGLYKDAFAAIAEGGDPASLREIFLRREGRLGKGGGGDPVVEPDPIVDPDPIVGPDPITGTDPDTTPDPSADLDPILNPDSETEPGALIDPNLVARPSIDPDLLPDPGLEDDNGEQAVAA